MQLSSLRVNANRLQETIKTLSKFGRQPNSGISRLTFSKADLDARAYVSKLMVSSGMSVSVDKFANIIGRFESDSRIMPAVICGSHIDTVPNGGPLDGAYGVLAALEVARTIHRHKLALDCPLEVVVFTEEEGVRFPSFTGSLGFTGFLSPERAYRFNDKNGVTFKEALRRAGYDPTRLRFLHRSPRRTIKAYVEAHIEQGPTLERERIQIGIVTAIVGLAKLEVTVRGQAGHAGTTPMNLRKDALIGAAHLISETNRIARKTTGTVATTGSINVLPNVSNVIPESVMLGIDVRARISGELRSLQRRIIGASRNIANTQDLSIRVETRSVSRPISMSRNVIRAITNATSSLGLSYKQLHSGAGHDCQNMARVTEAGMIFVASRNGISHAPTESTSGPDLVNGANVLLHTVIRLTTNRIRYDRGATT